MSFSEASTRELNEELQVLVAAGDEDARNRMIEGNMRLAAFKVEEFVVECPQYEHLKDDLLGEAFIGLTEGVDQIRKEGAGSNPTALLAVCIRQQLLSAVETAGLIRVPRGRPPVNVVTAEAEGPARDPSGEREILEQINACCETDFERRVVAMRAEGHGDAMIAEATGVSRLKVQRTRRRLAEKFVRR